MNLKNIKSFFREINENWIDYVRNNSILFVFTMIPVFLILVSLLFIFPDIEIPDKYKIIKNPIIFLNIILIFDALIAWILTILILKKLNDKKLLFFEKISAYFKKFNDYSDYYLKRRPLSWNFILCFISFAGIISVLILAIIVSLPFMILKVNPNVIIVMLITMLGFSAVALYSILWSKLIIEKAEKNLEQNKPFFLSFFWKNWFVLEDKILNNNHISKIIKINTFFVNPKNRKKSNKIKYTSLAGVFCFACLFFYFIVSILSFSFIFNFIVFFATMTLVLPMIFFAAYLIIGEALLILEKFRPTPELNEENVNE